jgi:enamine deaminase RidA (YjgF/YER057c/UK114 family)
MTITRHHTNQRMSQIVIHNDVVYLAGQVGTMDDSVADQTQQCLDKIDILLTEAGCSKESVLQTTIWLADMADFEEMNGVWDAWVAPGHAPARACGEAKLARPGFKVEILVIAGL